MRFEQEFPEKIMDYDAEGEMSLLPMIIFRTKAAVDKAALEAAVHCAVRCHPRFGCRFAEDDKGPYLTTNPDKPVIAELSPEKEYFFGGESNHHFPWIVGFHEKEIIYAGRHGLSDIMGTMIFLRTVLYYYFKAQGLAVDPGNAVTLETITPDYLDKDTECSIKKNGTQDVPSRYDAAMPEPTIFPETLLREKPEEGDVYKIAVSLTDLKRTCNAYEVSQASILATCLAQAIWAALPGSDNFVRMSILADMRGVLKSQTTHNCSMIIRVPFSQRFAMGQPQELLYRMLGARLKRGFNRNEALHSCYDYAQMERWIGGNKNALAGASAMIKHKFWHHPPIAFVPYSHITHPGLSDELMQNLEDVYFNYTGLRKECRQVIPFFFAITTNRVVNLVMIDGTRDSLIRNALEQKLTEEGMSYTVTKLDKYKGILARTSLTAR